MGTKNQPNDDPQERSEEVAEKVTPESVAPKEHASAGDGLVNDSGSDTVAFSSDFDPAMEETGDQADTIDQLVVYLDGQLEGEQRRSVEASILSDPKLQVHIAALQESWDALDALERPDAGENFTESTVKFVVTSELLQKKRTSWPKYLRYGLLGAAAAICLFVGYSTTQYYRTADQREFYQDYPLIENLDLYQGAGDFDFLVQIQDEDFFPQGEPDDQ